MADKRPVWDAIVKKEKLQPIPYEQMVSWEYGDFAFRQGFDNVSSTIKMERSSPGSGEPTPDRNSSHRGRI